MKHDKSPKDRWESAKSYEDFMGRFWDAAVELDPAASQYDEGQRFPVCSPSALEEAFRLAGFSHIRIEPIEIVTHFKNFKDYWSPFVGGPGPAPGYLNSLSVHGQEDLKERLKVKLSRNDDGSISLKAKAWAARAVKGAD